MDTYEVRLPDGTRSLRGDELLATATRACPRGGARLAPVMGSHAEREVAGGWRRSSIRTVFIHLVHRKEVTQWMT